jgi:hypothetical protein
MHLASTRSLPIEPALTLTITTLVQAPTINITKSDGRTTVEPRSATYTRRSLHGTVTATALTITDVLPADVTVAGPVNPAPDHTNGQTLVWDSLPSLNPGGGIQVIEIPVQVKIKTPNATVLSNMATIQDNNNSGHVFAVQSAGYHHGVV